MVRAIRLFAPQSFTRVILADIAVICASFYAAAWLTLFLDPLLFFFYEGGAARVIPIVVCMVLAMYFADLYGRRPRTSRLVLLQQLSLVGGVALLSEVLISYLNPDWGVPKLLVLTGALACMVSLFCWRLLLAVINSRMAGARRVLILGADETVRRIARHIEQTPELDYAVAGSLTLGEDEAVAPVLGTVADLKETALQIKPALIIAGFDDNRHRIPIGDMLDLRFGGAAFEEAGTAYETVCRRVSARDLRPSRTLFTDDFDAREQFLVIALADRLIAATLLLLGAPFAIACAILFRFETGKPAFVSQRCAGFRGRPFKSLALRVPENGVVASCARALHIRSWPQLWNVLIGRMSMVGPRPERVGMSHELGRLLPIYDLRHNARPGITGWAQMHLHPSNRVIDSLDEVEYDLYYTRNQAPSLYAFILLHELKARTA